MYAKLRRFSIFIIMLSLFSSFAFADSLSGMIGRGSAVLLTLITNAWALSVLTLILLTLLFYYIYQVGMHYIPTFQKDDKTKEMGRKIALILAILSAIGLLGYAGMGRGGFSPRHIVSKTQTVLLTFGTAGIWFLAILFGAMAFWITHKGHGKMDGLQPPYNRRFRSSISIFLITAGATLWLGNSLAGNKGMAMLGFLMGLVGLVLMVWPASAGDRGVPSMEDVPRAAPRGAPATPPPSYMYGREIGVINHLISDFESIYGNARSVLEQLNESVSRGVLDTRLNDEFLRLRSELDDRLSRINNGIFSIINDSNFSSSSPEERIDVYDMFDRYNAQLENFNAMNNYYLRIVP